MDEKWRSGTAGWLSCPVVDPSGWTCTFDFVCFRSTVVVDLRGVGMAVVSSSRSLLDGPCPDASGTRTRRLARENHHCEFPWTVLGVRSQVMLD